MASLDNFSSAAKAVVGISMLKYLLSMKKFAKKYS